MKYRPEIDGLRALAALSVVIFHLDKTFLPGGFLGVDVFFVISGFLISSIIYRQILDGSWSFKTFFIRRIRRLAPALLTVCLLTLLVSLFVASPSRLQEVGRSGLFSVLYLSNIDFWQQSGYFDVGAAYKPLLHTWSLSVEEQFYLLWPVLIFLALKRSSRALFIMFAMLFMGSLFAASTFNSIDPAAVFFLMPFRIFEFAIGALLLFALPHLRLSGWNGNLMRLCGTLFLIGPFFLIDGTENALPILSLIPCLGTAMIILAGTQGQSHKLFTNELSKFFGKISYSLYLVHWPLITLYFLATFSSLSLWEKTCLFVASVVLAWALFTFVETPLRYVKGEGQAHQKSDRPMIVASLSASLLIACIGFIFIQTKGFPGRLNADQQALLRTANAKQINCPRADNSTYTLCTLGRDEAEQVDIVLIGDSHAEAVRTGFANYVEREDYKAALLHKFGTLPLLDVVPFRGITPRQDWRRIAESKIDYAIETKPNLVILVGRWSLPYYTDRPGFEYQSPGFLARKATEEPNKKTSREAYQYGLDTTLKRFRDEGIPVLIVGQVPHNGLDLRDCLSRPVWILGPGTERCSYFTAEEWAERTAPVDQFLRDAIGRAGHGRFISTTDYFCGGQNKCRIERDGKLLYFDDDHLSPHGADFLFENLEPEIAKLMAR